MKQKAVRACGLISMVFDNQRLAREICQQEWRQCRPSHVDDIRRSNESQEFAEPRTTNHAKGERTVVVASCRSLRNQGDIEFRKTLCITDLREATGEGKDDSLHPADAGRKEMAVDEELHPDISSETGRERGVSKCKTIPTTSLVIRVCVRMCRESREYSGFGPGLAVLSWRT